MVQPINYMTDVLNPIEGYMQGLKFGEGLNTERLNQQATTQNMGIQREQMDLAQAQFAAQEQARAQQQAAAQAAARAQQEQAQAGSQALMSYLDALEAGTATPADLRRGMAAFPQLADQFQAFASSVSEERLGNEMGFGKQLAFALSNDSPEAAQGLLQERLEGAEAAGDERAAAVARAQLMQLDENPNGLLMQTLMPLVNTMGDDFDAFHNDILGLGGGDGAGVRSSEILEDGTVVQSTDAGSRVINPQGEVVTGQAAADAIAAARAKRVENERAISGARVGGGLEEQIALGGEAEGARELGQLSMQAGVQAFSDISKVNSSLSNIDEAIGSIDKGAASGIVYNMLPNVTEASASLNNAMNRMGLDVIGSVTFGALSEGEMKLAMETAVPRDLRPAELRDWLVRKRDAQVKARDALTKAAQYLTTPGNTINSWLAEQEGSAPDAGGATPPTGGVTWSIVE